MAADGEKQMAVDTGRPATALATYVALRTMLCRVSGARRASDCLRAERALCGRRRFRSLSRERNIFSNLLTDPWVVSPAG